MDPKKEKKLIAAIVKINNLCNELQIPELVSAEAARTVLEESRARWLKQKTEFLIALGPEPRTNRVQ